MLLSLNVHFLLSKPGSILKRLADVLALEIRVVCQDLFLCGAMRKLSHDHRNWNSHASDAGAAPHHVAFKCDPVKHP